MTDPATPATAERQSPDANCYTLPNGECVSDKDCMHGPATAARPPCPRCGYDVVTLLRRCAGCGWFIGWGTR